jgi:[ribosomal protein S5]-alanine N-acetyltransferase
MPDDIRSVAQRRSCDPLTLPFTALHFPPLETARLFLRSISYADTSFVIQHFLDPIVQRYLYDDEPITTPEQATAILDFYLAAPDADYNRWTIVRKTDHQPIGTCGFHKWSRPHRRAEIGYDLSPVYQGYGYMTEAVEAMVQHGFSRLNLHRIEALVAVENTRSLALLQRLSFQQEGLLREYFWSNGKAHDHYMLARLCTDVPPNKHDLSA